MLSILAVLCWMGVSSSIFIKRNNDNGILLSSSQIMVADRSLSLDGRSPTGHTFQFLACEQQQQQQKPNGGEPLNHNNGGRYYNPDDSFVALLEVCKLYNRNQFGEASPYCDYYHVAAAEWVHFVGEFIYQRLVTDYCAVCDQCHNVYDDDEGHYFYNNNGEDGGDHNNDKNNNLEPSLSLVCNMDLWSDGHDCATLCDHDDGQQGGGYPTGLINTAESTQKYIEGYYGGDVKVIGKCFAGDNEMGRHLSHICEDRPPDDYKELQQREKCHYDKAFDWVIYLVEWVESCDQQGYPDEADFSDLLDGHKLLICDNDDSEDGGSEQNNNRDMFGNRPSACAAFLQVAQQGAGPIQNIPSSDGKYDIGFGGEPSQENPPSSTVLEDLSVSPEPSLSSAFQFGQEDNNNSSNSTSSSFKLLATAFVGGMMVTAVLFYAGTKFKVVASTVPIVEPQFQLLELTEVS